MKGSFEVQSVEETWALATQVAAELKAGDILCLEGDLGAGKTTFTQGLAHALGVQEHPATGGASIPLLVHMDLYRLHGEDDVLAIGWEDYLAQGAVLVVEWPERVGSLIPPDARHIVFLHRGEENRQIDIDI